MTDESKPMHDPADTQGARQDDSGSSGSQPKSAVPAKLTHGDPDRRSIGDENDRGLRQDTQSAGSGNRSGGDRSNDDRSKSKDNQSKQPQPGSPAAQVRRAAHRRRRAQRPGQGRPRQSQRVARRSSGEVGDRVVRPARNSCRPQRSGHRGRASARRRWPLIHLQVRGEIAFGLRRVSEPANHRAHLLEPAQGLERVGSVPRGESARQRYRRTTCARSGAAQRAWIQLRREDQVPCDTHGW